MNAFPQGRAALLLGLSLLVAVMSLALLVLILLLGHPPVPVNPSAINWYARHMTQAGIASWYGPHFHGRKTANGEHFDQNAMTAAHRTLRFGSFVVVTRTNGRSVEVRINDRGPFIRGRIIDVSYAAAVQLGMMNAGLARVQIQVRH